MSHGVVLPVDRFKDEILNTTYESNVTIVTAPTGSGKSTRIPQMLLNCGSRIVVTEPRRLAAHSLAEWVGLQVDGYVGGQIGYRTGFEQCDSRQTRCLYCTDGLQLVRELLGQNKNRDILILDEFHERNISQDALLAWCHRELKHKSWFRLIVMSATIDAERLSRYFWNAPIINIPGSLHSVKTITMTGSMSSDITTLLRQKKNVLVFLPGKREIRSMLAYLNRTDLEAVFLPLHGDLDWSEQELCFRHYSSPKCVLATNIAETSITIDDIDAVVDSGLKREVLTANDVEGLYTVPISLAEETQRRGRAGRTKPGVYISHCPLDETLRSTYPVPEIKRRLLASVMLRLKADGHLPMEQLDFLDQPPREQFPIARQMLIRLDCFDQTGEVTQIGAKINRLPVSPQLARMIIEAERWGVLADVIDIAAIIEADGIVDRGKGGWKSRFASNEEESDILAQLQTFRAAMPLLESHREELEELGINVRSLKRAREIRDKIKQSSLLDWRPSPCRIRRRRALLLCICAGLIDHVYIKDGAGWNNGDGRRMLSNDSVIPRNSQYLVGIPFDVNTESDDSYEAVRLIHWATKIPEKLVPRTLCKYHGCQRKKRKDRGNGNRRSHQNWH